MQNNTPKETERKEAAAQFAACCRELAAGFEQMESEQPTAQDWREALDALREITAAVERAAVQHVAASDTLQAAS